jgi:hypothetical protein
MSREEKSLLLYFECCMVDYGGKVQSARMNADDFKIAEEWNKTGFVKFGRIKHNDIDWTLKVPFNYWCVLSADAWDYAHAERKARSDNNVKALGVFRIGYDEEEQEANG